MGAESAFSAVSGKAKKGCRRQKTGLKTGKKADFRRKDVSGGKAGTDKKM